MPAEQVSRGPVRSRAFGLPSQTTSFVGRNREIATAAAALADHRLVTLIGPGACGKTRLASQLVTGQIDRYPGGIWWVELASLSAPDQVAAQLADTLDVRPLPGLTALAAVQHELADTGGLVILDNCEHLLPGVAELVDALLRDDTSLTILLTSRVAVGLEHEVLVPVPPLSLPLRADIDNLDELLASEAARLFVDRAQRARANFALTAENASTIASICIDLDGIPLAIELAAARVALMSPYEIANRLHDRFSLLSRGAPDALPQHRTLRASVEWSHQLLGEQAQALLARLGVFAGGWTLELAEAACAGDGLTHEGVLNLLGDLVDSSLVAVDADDRFTRFHLLETVREFAAGQLEAQGGLARARARHGDAMLALAERAAPNLLGEDQPRVLTALGREEANFTAALQYASESDSEMLLRLVIALTFHWKARGSYATADRWYESTLSRIAVNHPQGAYVNWARGHLRCFAGDFAGSIACAHAALALAATLGDRQTEGRALALIGTIDTLRDPAAARPRLSRARTLATDTGDDWGLAQATQFLAYTFQFQHRLTEAAAVVAEIAPVIERTRYREFVALDAVLESVQCLNRADWDGFDACCRRGLSAAGEIREPVTVGALEDMGGLGDLIRGLNDRALERMRPAREAAFRAGAGMSLAAMESTLARAEAAAGQPEAALARLAPVVASGADGGRFLSAALVVQAGVLHLQGDADAARQAADQALAIAAGAELRWMEIDARSALARLALDDEAWSEAQAHVQGTVASLEELRSVFLSRTALELLAGIAAGQGDPERAARLLGAAAKAGTVHQLARLPWDHERTARVERLTREALGGAQFETAWTEGAGLDVWAALAWARRARGVRRRPDSGWASLTPTELEVAERVAAGLTNAQIGRELFITAGTAKVHVSHIYTKLGIRGRAELTAEVVRRRVTRGV